MAITTIDGPATLRVESDENKCYDALTILLVDTFCSPAPTDSTAGTTVCQAVNHRQIELVTGLVEKRRGTVVKMIGNWVMVEFPQPACAVRAGIEIERLLQGFNNTDSQNTRLDPRIGIHSGAASCSGIDGLGDLMNVAADITKRAEAGQILVSRSVYEKVSRESDLLCQWLGKASIQGRTEQEDVFEVSWVEAPADIPARYKVLSQIGAGGMGIVYKVRDLDTTEFVALKVLKPGIASDPAMQESLRREVCLARKVTHKNVCRIYEFNRSSGAACISMEFIEGESLSSRLRRNGPPPLPEAIEIVRQICAGLREAHLQGIVHRDLKPANIIVDHSGSVKIMDFGIARLIEENCQMTGTIAGTPAYMAPEQVELKHVDARTDIYAIGLLLYEMIVGSPAFDGDNPIAVAVKQLRDLPKRPREIAPALSTEIEDMVLRCLEKDPAKRFQSVDELDGALKQQQEAEPKSKPAADCGIVPEIRRMVCEAQELLGRGIEEVRPALSLWASKLEQDRRELLGIARGCAQKTRGFIRTRDWRAITAIRSQQALAGLGLVVLVGCAIAFALGRGGKSPSEELVVPSTAYLVPSHASAFNDGVTAERSALATQKSELNGMGDAPSSKASASTLAAKEGSSRRSPALNPTPNSGSRTSTAVVRQPASRASRLSSGIFDAANDQPTVNAEPEIVETTPVPIDTMMTPPDITKESQPTAPGSSLSFLDVEAFKDTTWANNAVEKLTQLGFHAVSVHKGHLWSQSYHVEVGPYASAKDLENAQNNLALHGFKSHVVK